MTMQRRGVLPPHFRKPFSWLLLLSLVGLRAPAAAADDVKKPAEEPLPAALNKPAPDSLEDLKAIQQHVKKVLAKVVPATVGVQVGMAQGSGVIISEDGYVLTAGHVSAEPNRSARLILPNGKILNGKTLGWNKNIDSGLIKITEEGKWPFAEMGDSAKLKNGQWCLSVGHPGGYHPGRSPVVRLGRILEHRPSYLVSDCTLVGGDSGGPLFDMEGKVIGIHSRIGPTITSNIHVPVNTYRETWDKLVKGDKWGGFLGGRDTTNDPYLGIDFDPSAKDCKIVKVVAESPAAKAGLQKDDVLTKFDNQALATRADLTTLLGKKKPGDAVTVEVVRGKETLTLKLVVGKRG
jgi:serine protease Do